MIPAEFSISELLDTEEGKRILQAAAILVVMLGLEILLIARIVRKVRARDQIAFPDIVWTLEDMWRITLVLLPILALPFLLLMQQALQAAEQTTGMAGMWSDPEVLRTVLGSTALLELVAASLLFRRAFHHHKLPWSGMGFWFPGFREGLFRPLLWVGGFLLAEAAYEGALRAFGLPMRSQVLEALIGSAAGFVDKALVLLGAGLLIPFLEEILFRGFLFPLFMRYVGVGWGMGITTFLFAMGHLESGQGAGAWVGLCLRLPEFFGLGFLLCWLTWRSGSLVPAILAHVLNNLVGVGLLLRG